MSEVLEQTFDARVPPSATLALPQLLSVAADFPTHESEGTPSFVMAMIQSTASPRGAFGAPFAAGQSVPIYADPALFSIIGTSYGGDGQSAFAYPQLTDRSVVGGQPGAQAPDTLAMSWLIALQPGGPAPLIGTVIPFAGNFAPPGWAMADGSMLPINGGTVMLFRAIGNAFGGDGKASFALPDLRGATAIGVGQGPGLPPVAVGQKVGGDVPGLGLNYILSTNGAYPPPDGPIPANYPFLGQVVAWAGAGAPQDWTLCNGALLPIDGNQALYTLLGTNYGGDGKTSFALPDLRGRRIIGLQQQGG